MGSPLLPPAPMARASVCVAYRWRVGQDAHAWLLTFGDRNILGSAPSLSVADEEIVAVAKVRGFPEPTIIPHAPPEAHGQPRPKEVASA